MSSVQQLFVRPLLSASPAPVSWQSTAVVTILHTPPCSLFSHALPEIVRVVELSKACGSCVANRTIDAVTVGILERRGVAASALFDYIVDDSQHYFWYAA